VQEGDEGRVAPNDGEEQQASADDTGDARALEQQRLLFNEDDG
jgi:hypothetical protein